MTELVSSPLDTPPTLYRHMLRMGLILLSFAVVGTGLVALSFLSTQDRIAHNEKMALLRQINALLPPGSYDNDLLNDTLAVVNPNLLGSQEAVTFYRARQQGKPLAVVFMPVAPDGYSGKIRLLVGVRENGQLLGVRVISHQETPGLGDAIEEKRSPWINGFTGRSLQNPTEAGWRVKRDGGVFDQFTGATITPRAVVKAVQKSLQFYARHQSTLFAESVPSAQP